MGKEFKKQFDKNADSIMAKRLAYKLGYDEAYCDGATITSPTYREEMTKKTASLCGGKWTEGAKIAYQSGCHDGYMET